VRNYLSTTRRMLLDMHIPDWDDAFLRRHDPQALARCYETAGVTAVMMYCKSHLGLPYWPAAVGRQHPGLAGRDVVGELLAALRERDIAVCAYTSIAFEREAAASHPDWRIVTPGMVDGVPPAGADRPRHSAVCLNKPGYLAYEQAQLADLLGRYAFDACFLDMMFWGDVCVCEDCRRRFDEEVGGPLPERVDWADARWVAFADARERWCDELCQALLAHARACAKIPVYQNFAPAFLAPRLGKGLSAYRDDAFLGGDLYGGRDEQLLACKTMLALSRGRPPEFMTTRAPSLHDHASVKTEAEMTLQVLAATALSCAVLLIDAIDPDGGIMPAVYEQVGRVYARRAPFEPHLGGEHVEDVGVYLSGAALARPSENGAALADFGWSRRGPHIDAATGAVRALQQLHVAAGVVTELQLDELDCFSVLVVPDLTRVDAHELQAFAAYVRGGGRLYASGRTGMLGRDGTPAVRAAAEELLGVRFEGDEDGPEVFLRPAGAQVADAIAPQRYVSWKAAPEATVPPRIGVRPGAEVLATLTLPYAYPARGTWLDEAWASNYSNPPWEDTQHPLLVRHALGAGQVVYSALPLEAGDHAARALLGELLGELLGDRGRLDADAPATTWVEAFHQPERSRFVVALLDYPAEPSGCAVRARVRLRLPNGTAPAGARALGATETALELRALDDGRVEVEAVADPFALVAIDYRAAP